MVQNAVIIGKTDNTDELLDAASPHGIIAPRTEYFTIDGAKFYNLDFNEAAALGDCSHCFGPTQDSGARTFKTQGLVFDEETVPRKVRYQFPYAGIIHDLDGSLTGKGANSFASAYFRHLEVDECEVDKEVYDGVLCDDTV